MKLKHLDKLLEKLVDKIITEYREKLNEGI